MMYRIVIDANLNQYTIDNTYLYYPGDPDYTLYDIELELNVGESHELRFKVPKGHPNYDLVKLGYKHIYVLGDTNTDVFFNGVISEIDRDIYGNLSVYCTSILALLNYSVQPQAKIRTNLMANYLSTLLGRHMQGVDESVEIFFDFNAGDIYGGPSGGVTRYTNYETTLACIRRDIMEAYGIYPKFRYRWNASSTYVYNGKVPYIDFKPISTYGDLSTQEIRLGENVLQYVDSNSMDDVYTSVIPLGAKKSKEERTDTDLPEMDAYVDIRSVNSDSVRLVNSTAAAVYGVKCAVVHWEDETSPSALKTAGQTWLTNAIQERLRFKFTALDLANLGNDYNAFKVGDRVHCIAESLGVDATLPIYSMTIYPLEPEKNTLTVGADESGITTQASTSSAISADAETRMTLDELVLIKTYTASYSSVSSGSQVGLTATNFGMSAITGYSPIGIRRIAAGSEYMLIRAYNASATGSSAVINLYNRHTSAVSGTATIDVIYVRTSTTGS